MSENGYRMVVARMADEELISALRVNESMYLDEVLLAILDECEKRKISFPGAKELRDKILSRLIIEEEAVLVDQVEPTTKVLPVFFSQTAIMAFSIFFSPLFGGILLAINLWKVNKKGVWQVILFSVVFTAFLSYVVLSFPLENFLSLIIQFIGALILSEVLWNH
ncbi:MAG: hypothetical protein ACHQFW_04540, partial [Chitinophagales bacterium]